MNPSFSGIGRLILSFEFSQVLLIGPVPLFYLHPPLELVAVSLFDPPTPQPSSHWHKIVVESYCLEEHLLPSTGWGQSKPYSMYSSMTLLPHHLSKGII
nr:hypothetical protein CFP56_73463 [Quercus suber]